MLTDILQLDRPLVSVDLETTGLFATTDRIVQIGIVKVLPTGEVREWESLINPEMNIPIEATLVHGIDNNAIAGCKTFAQIAEKLSVGFSGCDFCGYNCKSFDIPFLSAEFQRVGIQFRPGRIIDAFLIYKKYNPRNLTSAVRQYLGEDHPDAHSALADARAAIRILREQFIRHEDLPRDIDRLIDVVSPKNTAAIDPEARFIWKNGEGCWNFGKHRGYLVKDRAYDKKYLEWIIGNPTFSDDVKKICKDAMDGKFPKK